MNQQVGNYKIIQIIFIENDFAKNLVKCDNLFKYFVSPITIILRKDTYLHYK